MYYHNNVDANTNEICLQAGEESKSKSSDTLAIMTYDDTVNDDDGDNDDDDS